MKAMTVVVVTACAMLPVAATPAGARPLHRRAAVHARGGRGEATFPITAGSSRVRINAVGEVITSDDGRGPVQPAHGGGAGK